MGKKYKTEQEGSMLRIIALKDFADVREGDRGGLIDKEENLSQEGDCWVYGNARVLDNARVYGSACIYENAKVCGDAKIFDNAVIFGNAVVSGNAKVCEDAEVCGRALVYENARILGHTRVCGGAKICGNVKLWTNKGFYLDNISTSIKDSKDYIILGTKGEFRIFSSDIKNLIDKEISIVEKNYIKNIQIIRQLYGNEI